MHFNEVQKKLQVGRGPSVTWCSSEKCELSAVQAMGEEMISTLVISTVSWPHLLL